MVVKSKNRRGEKAKNSFHLSALSIHKFPTGLSDPLIHTTSIEILGIYSSIFKCVSDFSSHVQNLLNPVCLNLRFTLRYKLTIEQHRNMHMLKPLDMTPTHLRGSIQEKFLQSSN